jgi:GcrA cell cycle regulator
MEWAQGTIDRLRALWDEGHSTAEIGRRLGVSKNSVVGKAHRLDLPSRPTPIKRIEGEDPKRPYKTRKDRRPIPAVGKISLPTLPSLQQPAPRLVSAPKAPRPVRPRASAPVVELPQKHRVFCKDCQWVVSLKPARLCDQPAERGSYCAPHAELAYVRPRDRRDDEYKIAA